MNRYAHSVVRRRKLATVCFSTLLVLSLAVATAVPDVIRLVPNSTVKASGGQIRGQITAENPLEVKIKPAVGNEQSVPVNQIDIVTYDATTPSFALADTRVNAGALAEAAELYKKAAIEAQGKPLLERAAQFARIHALANLSFVDPSKTAEAISASDEFVKSNGNSRQLGPALILLARLHLNSGDSNNAEAVLSDLSTRVPWAADRAAVLKARVFAKKGEHDAAIEALDRLLSDAPKGSPKAREALLAKAESLAANKKFNEAEAAVREVLEQSPAEDADVQAEAYNTLGDCLSAAGRPKDALLAYLRTDILFSGAKDQHARALARIVELWRELKQDARANEVRERLRHQYPQSPYVKGKSA